MSVIGQMFFSMTNGSRAFGWNESVVLVGAVELPAALTSLVALAEKRAALLGAGVKLPYLRVSNTDKLRDTQVVSGLAAKSGLIINAQGALQLLTFAASDPRIAAAYSLYNTLLGTGVLGTDLQGLIVDQPQVGLLVRCEGGATGTARRSYLLRGLPDDVVKTSTDGPRAANNVASANWLAAYEEWVTMMKSGPYGFFPLDTTDANPEKPVTAWAVANDTNVVTATIPELNATKGSKVRIRNVKLEGPTGEPIRYGDLLTVESVAGDNYVFSGGKQGNIFVRSAVLKTAVIFSNGVARKQNRTPIAFNNLVMRRWGNKKCGAPFDPPSGSVKSR